MNGTLRYKLHKIAMEKKAYGGDPGDGYLYERTYMDYSLDPYLPDDPEERKAELDYWRKNAKKEAKEAVEYWADTLKNYDKYPIIATLDDDSEVKIDKSAITLSKFPWHISDVTNDVEEISAEEWEKLYDKWKKSKSDEDLFELSSYMSYRAPKPGAKKERKKFLGIF